LEKSKNKKLENFKWDYRSITKNKNWRTRKDSNSVQESRWKLYNCFSLPPLDLAIRKMEAYSQRLFIRDLYDIMFLTNFLNKDDYYTKTKFKEFLSNIKKPVDEKILSSLILKGYSKFTFRMIVDYLRRWVGEV
jgi:hypothetical protein